MYTQVRIGLLRWSSVSGEWMKLYHTLLLRLREMMTKTWTYWEWYSNELRTVFIDMKLIDRQTVYFIKYIRSSMSCMGFTVFHELPSFSLKTISKQSAKLANKPRGLLLILIHTGEDTIFFLKQPRWSVKQERCSYGTASTNNHPPFLQRFRDYDLQVPERKWRNILSKHRIKLKINVISGFW